MSFQALKQARDARTQPTAFQKKTQPSKEIVEEEDKLQAKEKVEIKTEKKQKKSPDREILCSENPSLVVIRNERKGRGVLWEGSENCNRGE